MSKRPAKKPQPPTPPLALMLSREDYTVDGGRVLEDVGYIEMTHDHAPLAVTLQMPRGALAFYPIGAKIRVTVERLA